MYKIHLLPARFGDSILVEYGNIHSPYYILIDGGPYFAYPDIIDALKQVAPNLKTLELVVVTHVDIDHIDGIIRMLNQKTLPFQINELWFNGFEQLESANEQDDLLGGIQGELLTTLIKTKNIRHNLAFDGQAVIARKSLKTIKLPGGMKISLLSPTVKALKELIPVWNKTLKESKITQGDLATLNKKLEEDHRYKDISEKDDLLGDQDVESLAKTRIIRPDKSPANKSSIAFIGQYNGKTCLFAGDAPTSSLKTALEDYGLLNTNGKFSVDVWKLSHHGSKKSTLDELIKIVDCNRFLISTDGSRFQHPDAETIAKLIKLNPKGLQFYFNYSSEYNSRWDDKKLQGKYGYEAFYPKEEGGNVISIDL